MLSTVVEGAVAISTFTPSVEDSVEMSDVARVADTASAWLRSSIMSRTSTLILAEVIVSTAPSICGNASRSLVRNASRSNVAMSPVSVRTVVTTWR